MYEGSLCVCCMSTDDLVQLFGCKLENGEDVNYAKILAACLNVKLSEDEGHDSICKACVTLLKDCIGFKKQVLNSLSILSSIELQDLINEEVMQVLYPASSKSSVLETKEPKSRTTEQSRVAEDVQVQISPCSSTWEWEYEYEHNPKLQTASPRQTVSTLPSKKPKVKQEVFVKDRRSRRGRPRIHPLDTKMPYDIASDELECRECGEVFPNNVTLKVHYNKHFGQHKCTVCSKSFITYTSLAKHQRSHMEGPFKCFDCEQVFRSINSLYSHKRFKHSVALPYRCAVKDCGQRFATSTQRLKHLAARHRIAEYNHQCKYCVKKFRTSSERAKHTSTRHEVRYSQCGVCGARCRRAALRAHLRGHLGRGGAGGAGGARRFVCKLCSSEFGQKKTLVYHIGSHVRRGEYEGDPTFLILDKREQKNNCGLLSEEDPGNLDESVLSDKYDDVDFGVGDRDDDIDIDIGGSIAENIDSNFTDNIDIDDLEIDFIDDGLRKSEHEDINEICTDLAFSTPEYID